MIQSLAERAPYIITPLVLQTIVVAFSMFAVGIFGVVREQGSPVSITFFMLALGIGIWLFAFSMMYGATEERLAFWWGKVGYAGVSIIPAAAYHFRTYVLREPETTHARIRVVWLLSGAFALLSIVTDMQFHSLYHYDWGFYPKAGLSSIPFVVFFFGIVTDSMLSYLKIYHQRSEKGSTESARARYLLIAFIVAAAGSLDFLASFGIGWYPFGYLAILFFIVLSAYSIHRFKFMAVTPAFAARQIIDTMNDALIVLDPDGVIRVVNEAICVQFGLDARDLVGKRPLQAIPTCRAFSEKLEEIIRIGATRNSEVVCQPRQQEFRTLSLSATRMRNSAGEALATVCIISDVTERRRAEEEREKLIVKLQDALANVKRLSGLLPICASCKKIRDDSGYWKQIESYVREHSEAEFSHGLCPDCAEKQYAEFKLALEKIKAKEDKNRTA